MRFPLVILLGSILYGCSSVSEQALLAHYDNWHSIGQMDGERGHYQRAKVDLVSLGDISEEEFQQYKEGYVLGNSKFCSPENASEQGDRGIRYSGQCANTEFEDLAVEKWQSAYEGALAMESLFLDME